MRIHWTFKKKGRNNDDRFYRGERRDVKSFTPEERQDYLDKKQHTINEAKEAIAGMKARIAELERIQAMNPIRRWFYKTFHI